LQPVLCEAALNKKKLAETGRNWQNQTDSVRIQTVPR